MLFQFLFKKETILKFHDFDSIDVAFITHAHLTKEFYLILLNGY